jgi:hypothetical protein
MELSKQVPFIVDDEALTPKLSILQTIEISLFGSISIGRAKLNEHWIGEAEFFAFRCKEHGIVSSYPQGFERRLVCPICKWKELYNDFKRQEFL